MRGQSLQVGPPGPLWGPSEEPREMLSRTMFQADGTKAHGGITTLHSRWHMPEGKVGSSEAPG